MGVLLPALAQLAKQNELSCVSPGWFPTYQRQSFETWRAARTATAQSDQNPELLRRARQLDAQLERERQLAQGPLEVMLS